ncbi:MAG: hypothetical protein AAF928_09795 [Myxococcota bacterium]
MDAVVTDYRDAKGALAARCARAREANEGQLEPALTLATLYGRAAGRVAAGLTATALVVVAFVFALVELGAQELTTSPTVLFLCALPAAAPVYLLTRTFATLNFRRALKARYHAGEGRDAIEALEEGVFSLATKRVNGIRVLGLSLPLAAIAMAGPLLLHFAVYVFAVHLTADLQMAGFPLKLEGFTIWIAASAMMVGVAHAALVVLSHDFVVQLVNGLPRRRWWIPTLGWTTLASMVPGIVAFGLPVLLTLVTGAVIIPLMYGWARQQHAYEEQLLAVAGASAK